MGFSFRNRSSSARTRASSCSRFALYHLLRFRLQLGHALGQPVIFAVAPQFPMLRKAGQYASFPARSRAIAHLANARGLAHLWPERLTSGNPLSKITIIGSPPRDRRRHAESSEPCGQLGHTLVNSSWYVTPRMASPGGVRRSAQPMISSWTPLTGAGCVLHWSVSETTAARREDRRSRGCGSLNIG